MNYDTIVSIATADGLGAIGVVRLSGENAEAIGKEIFSSAHKKYEPRKLYLGNVSCDGVKDQVLMVIFKKPFSFTGEDVVELQCHGGEVLLRAVVRKCIQLGARPATQGEFSKRAFMNGKMSLSEVEGMADLINAESESEAEIAFGLFGGGLNEKVKILQEKLMDIMLFVEASFDYPEEDMPEITTAETLSTIAFVKEELSKLLSTYSYGRRVKDGVKVAIIGNSNVGKSSILNRLCGEERAIVTEIEGTTRDVVEVKFCYKDIKFTFFDTAGIRETDDIVEKIGVKKGRAVAQKADIILAVFDERGVQNEIIELCKKEKTIVVFNKIDKSDFLRHGSFDDRLYLDVVEISARNNINMNILYEKIYNVASKEKKEGLVLTNERHFATLEKACEMTLALEKNIHINPSDLVAIDMKELWETLGQITGTTSSEEIISAIFSRLCLGK